MSQHPKDASQSFCHDSIKKTWTDSADHKLEDYDQNRLDSRDENK